MVLAVLGQVYDLYSAYAAVVMVSHCGQHVQPLGKKVLNSL